MYNILSWFSRSGFRKKIYRTLLLFIIVYLIIRIYYRFSSSVEQKEIIIDVRSKLEWDMGHDPHAIHLPHTKISEYKGDKDQHIKVSCTSGRRAAEAKYKLEEMGYKNVSVIRLKGTIK
jgi:rhodanese-related sulfurtransferase